jgi:hypothetical protein
MSDFEIYLPTGFSHIVDLAGADHILFLLTLCTGYLSRNLKKLVWLVTAFTVGHCITLAVSTLWQNIIPQVITERLIALTILMTAIFNVADIILKFKIPHRTYYVLSVLFGFVHGMGFSSLLINMLGKEQNLFAPLFFFNIGLELGQLIIVGVIILINLIWATILRHRYYLWLAFANFVITLIAAAMLVERFTV